jgi:hypothetical protein
MVYQHNKTYNTSGTATKWGSGNTVDGAQALLLGAQAAGLSLLGELFWRESDTSDYGNKASAAVGRKLGMLKPQFISQYDSDTRQDFSVMAVKTAAAE